MDLLSQFGFLILVATIFGFVLKRLNVPLLVAYILSGIIFGFFFEKETLNLDVIKNLAQIGLMLIAFEIGASIRWSFLKKEGLKLGIIVLIEFLTVAFLALLFGLLFNFSKEFLILIVLFAMNTSSVIAFKILEDKKFSKELDERSIKTLFGISGMEDLFAIIAISVLLLFFTSKNITISFVIYDIFHLIISFVGIIIFSLLVVRGLIDKLPYDDEILLLLGFSFLLIFGWFANNLGLSTLLGAFVAGLVFSETKVSQTFLERAKWIREIFGFLFFTYIGLIFPTDVNINLLVVGVITTLLIVFLKFVAFSFSLWITGYELRNAIRLGTYMIAISEFAIIISSLALEYGFASKEILTISVLVVIISSLLASLVSSNSELVSEVISELIPISFRNFVNKYVSPFFEKILNSTNEKRFEELRKIIKEVLIVVSVIFLVSFLVTYFINYLSAFRSVLGEFYLILVGSFLLSLFAIIAIEFYLIFKKLLDFLIREFEKTTRFRKNNYRFKKIYDFKIFDLSLSLRKIILIFIFILIAFVILCYYFLNCKNFDKIENFLDVIFLISVLATFSVIFAILLIRFLKKIKELLD